MSSQQAALDAVPSGHDSGSIPNEDVHLAALSGASVLTFKIFLHIFVARHGRPSAADKEQNEQSSRSRMSLSCGAKTTLPPSLWRMEYLSVKGATLAPSGLLTTACIYRSSQLS
jgi:hypothetical protein